MTNLLVVLRGKLMWTEPGPQVCTLRWPQTGCWSCASEHPTECQTTVGPELNFWPLCWRSRQKKKMPFFVIGYNLNWTYHLNLYLSATRRHSFKWDYVLWRKCMTCSNIEVQSVPKHGDTDRHTDPSSRQLVWEFSLTNGHEGNLPSHVVSSSNYNARLSSSVAAAAASLSLLLRHSLCHL